MRDWPIGQEFELQRYEGLKSKFMITKTFVTLDDILFKKPCQTLQSSWFYEVTFIIARNCFSKLNSRWSKCFEMNPNQIMFVTIQAIKWSSSLWEWLKILQMKPTLIITGKGKFVCASEYVFLTQNLDLQNTTWLLNLRV